MRSSNEHESVPRANLLAFLVISFGYMLPWTALGSLISYYKETYGADFYVKIYCLYYLPGLPIALIQYQYDEVLDARFGSRNTYQLRGVGSFVVMMIVLFTMIGVQNEYFLLLCFTILGICGWLCHGTASMLAAMYPSGAIANLQIGFRFPEIFSLAATYLFSLGSNATVLHLRIFYGLTGCIVFASLVCWVLLVRSRTSRVYFAAKDFALRTHSKSSLATAEETEQLLSPSGGRARASYTLAADANDFTSEEDDHEEERQQDYIDTEFREELVPDRTQYSYNPFAATTTMLATDDTTTAECTQDRVCSLNPITWFSYPGSTTPAPPPTPRSCSALCVACSADPTCISCTTNIEAENSALPLSAQLARVPAPVASNGDNRVLRSKGLPACSIAPLCAALMITIWSSIFQAAFFAYVSSLKDRNIEQTLYFVRLFADLLGRPLTFLPRPYFLKTNHQLLRLAVGRALLLVVFFVYVFTPQVKANDTFILAFEAVYSLLAGYIGVLVYEYAARDSTSRAARARAASTLNMGFQMAAFTAVVMSVAISTSLTISQ